MSLLDLAAVFLEGQNRTSAGPIRCNGCILGSFGWREEELQFLWKSNQFGAPLWASVSLECSNSSLQAILYNWNAAAD